MLNGNQTVDLQNDFAGWGIAAPAEIEPDDFELWDEHIAPVDVFLRCQTQWRCTMSGVLGLDYVAVRWIFKLYAVEDQAGVLEDLQILEAEAVRILNDRGST